MHVVRRVTREWRLGIVAGGVGVAAALGGAAIPTAAAASPHHVVTIELISTEAMATTSTGHQVLVDLDTHAKPNAVAGNQLVVTISELNGAGGANGEEDHAWMFPINTEAFTARPSGNGALTVKAGTLGGFGVLNLTMTPTARPTTERCGGAAAAAISHVKLAGTLLFRTHSGGAHKWGSIGAAGAKHVFTFPGRSQLTQYYAGGEKCLNGGSAFAPQPCASALQWDSGGADVDLSGFEFPGTHVVEGSRFVMLHKPYGAMRMDDMIAVVPSPTFLTAPDKTKPVSRDAMLGVVSQSPSSEGKALLVSSSAASPHAEPCGSHGKSVNVTFWPATYRNAITPLTLKADVFGAMRDRNNADAMVMAVDASSPAPAPTPTAPTPTATPTPSVAQLVSPRAAVARVEGYSRTERIERFRS